MINNEKKRLSDYLKQNHYKIFLALGEINLAKKPIGQGGNGVVYEGDFNGNEVAIKFLITEATGESKQQKLNRFIAEYFNVITIPDTTNIVRCLDYDLLKFTDDDDGDTEIPCIIMKRYECSLSKLGKANNKEEFLKLFNFLTSIVAKIHKEGIIHRDIKPENILVGNNGFVLADFGIASYNPEVFKIRAETKKSERMGNRLFSAPEQENSGEEPQPTMDIYAIGQILQWYATGATHRGTGRQKIVTEFKGLEIYDSVIDRCLSQQPNNRFQTINELLEYIKQSRDKDLFDYLCLFNSICRRCFPKNEVGIIHSDDKNKIDRLLLELKDNEKEFDDRLRWMDGRDSFQFTLLYKGNGVWKFCDDEYDIKEIWVSYNTSMFNDFMLFHFQKGEPFKLEGNAHHYTAVVDDTYHISYPEYSNGYAEIEGKVWDLSEHKVEFINRQENEGYFFIGTRHHCILQGQNEEYIKSFIENLLQKNKAPTIDELHEFRRQIVGSKDDEVRKRL